jgi:hypothetical protein
MLLGWRAVVVSVVGSRARQRLIGDEGAGKLYNFHAVLISAL